MEIKYAEILITGTVQGVGFRPFVYRTASLHNIKGTVSNNQSGVKIDAFGNKADLELFINTIKASPPPLSVIRNFSYKEKECKTVPEGFKIIQSSSGEENEIDITPDTAICSNCLNELNNENNRRYLHPFINCTDCGPRYTIIKKLPYDRPNTTMREFEMCPDCKKEYNNPADRRFHAQPVCCPNCGPEFKLLDKKGNRIHSENPVRDAGSYLENGKIVAVKGIGGFHLACRADSNDAVSTLRKRKNREEKPFAIMAKDIKTALEFADISDIEINIIDSIQKPIVLVNKKKNSFKLISEITAPNVSTLGIMLPYTPLHYLLFKYGNYNVLIMTSANKTDNPMEYTNTEAVKKLKGIADYFLTNNRDIYSRNDDSIVRVINNKPFFLRRARGFVPEPLQAPHSVDGVIACGGILKNTVTAGRKNMCYVSQYIGTMDNIETFGSMERILDNLVSILKIKPGIYAIDSHPENPGKYYINDKNLPVKYIQHHHAHAAACMAENKIREKTVCITFDGTGYGDDGNIWGGEILIADYSGFTRFAHLDYVPMPGGDEAVKHPWRMAIGHLYNSINFEKEYIFKNIPAEDIKAVLEILNSGISCPRTSSMGRLFDSLSAILGICMKRNYEGQPAIELETASDTKIRKEYGFNLINKNPVIINAQEILVKAFKDKKRGIQIPVISAKFHNTIARITSVIAKEAVKHTSSNNVCLSGGCFQNALLLQRTIEYLKEEGLNPVTHRLVSPNDEGISYGQAVIAGAELRKLN